MAELRETSDMLMSSALKINTHKTYSSAQNKYLNFCSAYDIVPLPATEETLLLYVAFLFDLKLKGSSIRVYLAAVRSLHVFLGFGYPTDMLRLKLAVKGAMSQSLPPVRKLPITFQILGEMLCAISTRFDFKLIAAAMSLAFFGCFRSGELFITDSRMPFAIADNLCAGDVLIDRREKMLSIFLKKSKTDTCSQGVSVFVGCSGNKVCGYCAVVRYIDVMGGSDPDVPFFRDCSGGGLSKSYFVSVTRIALAIAGYDPSLFSGHSYRAGAATSAGDAGFDAWELQMLGRWNSSAYTIYLRNPKVVSTFAKRLVPH